MSPFRHSFPLVLACVGPGSVSDLLWTLWVSSVLSVPWGQEVGVRAGGVARCHLIQMPRASLSCAAQGVPGTSEGKDETGL